MNVYFDPSFNPIIVCNRPLPFVSEITIPDLAFVAVVYIKINTCDFTYFIRWFGRHSIP